MPVQRPHYWHELKPVTSNQTYGLFLQEELSMKPREEGTGPYKTIRKPNPDLTYTAYTVPVSKKLELPAIVHDRNRDRKAIVDPIHSTSAPWLTESLGHQPWDDNDRRYARPFSSVGSSRPVAMSFNPSYVPYKSDRSKTALGVRTKHQQASEVHGRPLYLWHTNSGYLVRVVP